MLRDIARRGAGQPDRPDRDELARTAIDQGERAGFIEIQRQCKIRKNLRASRLDSPRRHLTMGLPIQLQGKPVQRPRRRGSDIESLPVFRPAREEADEEETGDEEQLHAAGAAEGRFGHAGEMVGWGSGAYLLKRASFRFFQKNCKNRQKVEAGGGRSRL